MVHEPLLYTDSLVSFSLSLEGLKLVIFLLL